MPNIGSWERIFEELGKQLHGRRLTFLKRVLVIFAPALVLVFVILLTISTFDAQATLSEDYVKLWTRIILWAPLLIAVTLLVTWVLLAIFKIEQAIWLNAYLEGRSLSSRDSWLIARRLYIPWSNLQVSLFFRYYIWSWLALSLSVSLWIYLFLTRQNADESILSSTLFILVVGVGLVLWTKYLKVKLAYFPFVFLDKYDDRKKMGEIWLEMKDEMKQLNAASRGDSFRKNLMIELGGDVSIDVTQRIAAWIGRGLSLAARALPGPAERMGGMLSVIISWTLSEIGYRFFAFAKLASRYVLYESAHRQVHGAGPKANERIYSLTA